MKYKRVEIIKNYKTFVGALSVYKMRIELCPTEGTRVKIRVKVKCLNRYILILFFFSFVTQVHVEEKQQDKHVFARFLKIWAGRWV